jgi:hypothetical protein
VVAVATPLRLMRVGAARLLRQFFMRGAQSESTSMLR